MGTSRDAEPISLFQEKAKSRIPERVPIRCGRMLVPPGTFCRGADQNEQDIRGPGHGREIGAAFRANRSRWLVFYGCSAGRGDRLEASERVTWVAVTREFVGLL